MKKILLVIILLSGFALANDKFNEYKKACDGGNARGCSDLGTLYKDGKGVEQDYHRAAEFFKKACDDGDDWGCAHLGTLYKDGKGVEQDYHRAAEFFKKACDLGLYAGCVYYKGVNNR